MPWRLLLLLAVPVSIVLGYVVHAPGVWVFFVACLGGHGLMRVELNGTAYVSSTKLFESLGRCREVIMAPDGKLYFTTSNKDGRGSPQSGDDRVMRIVKS